MEDVVDRVVVPPLPQLVVDHPDEPLLDRVRPDIDTYSQIYDHTDHVLAEAWVDEIVRNFADPEMPVEVRRLGRTIDRWSRRAAWPPAGTRAPFGQHHPEGARTFEARVWPIRSVVGS